MATNDSDPEFDYAVLAFSKLTRRRQLDVLCDLMSTYRQGAHALTRKLSPTHDECRNAFIRAVQHEGRE